VVYRIKIWAIYEDLPSRRLEQPHQQINEGAPVAASAAVEAGSSGDQDCFGWGKFNPEKPKGLNASNFVRFLIQKFSQAAHNSDSLDA
jgi:hypothetical protein